MSLTAFASLSGSLATARASAADPRFRLSVVEECSTAPHVAGAAQAWGKTPPAAGAAHARGENPLPPPKWCAKPSPGAAPFNAQLGGPELEHDD
eukprot:8454727-Heterocapsa_arctica.AAC.1